VISECSLSGRGQGHVSNFYIVDLENFATVSRALVCLANTLLKDGESAQNNHILALTLLNVHQFKIFFIH